MSETNNIFYGCYQGNYEKRYKWQCKKFNTEKEATAYAVSSDNNHPNNLTILIPINKYCPTVFHRYLIKQGINNIFGLDIN